MDLTHFYKKIKELNPSMLLGLYIIPSVNMALMIELNCENFILNFKLISINEHDLKFNISTTLGLQIVKSPLRNLIHQGLSPISLKYLTFILDFFLTKIVQYSIIFAP
jgi:hypothetical protein